MPYKEKICGVYTITTPNGSVYVGSSHNIKLRWSEHRSRLRHGRHHSERLQAAWKMNKYKEKFGVFPRGLSQIAKPPTQETLGWIKSRAIAFAKSRAKTS